MSSTTNIVTNLNWETQIFSEDMLNNNASVTQKKAAFEFVVEVQRNIHLIDLFKRFKMGIVKQRRRYSGEGASGSFSEAKGFETSVVLQILAMLGARSQILDSMNTDFRDEGTLWTRPWKTFLQLGRQ